MEQAVEFKKWGMDDDDMIIKGISMDPEKKADPKNILAARIAMLSKNQKTFDEYMKKFSESCNNPDEEKIMREKVVRFNPDLMADK